MSLANCNLNTLTAAAKCFNCLSATEKEALKVYFMAAALKAAGGTDYTNINTRNQAAACLGCEPDFVLDSMEVAIWQNLAVNFGASLPTSISALRALIRCTPCGEQKTTRAAFTLLLCQLSRTALPT
jgi:hypothetical protein